MSKVASCLLERGWSYNSVMEAPKEKDPARLYCILAREAPIGVIFRRGPSKWVQVIKWNTLTDEIEEGQWFHGRIYEQRCDLSPDGTKLIYFAQKLVKPSLSETDYTYAWTAVSKLPYLTALALWPKGDCWNGGGLFDANDRIWLNHEAGSKPHKDHVPPREMYVRSLIRYRGEDSTVEGPRMEREKWRVLQPLHCLYTFSSVTKMIALRISSIDALDIDWLSRIHDREAETGYTMSNSRASINPRMDLTSVRQITDSGTGCISFLCVATKIRDGATRVLLTHEPKLSPPITRRALSPQNFTHTVRLSLGKATVG